MLIKKHVFSGENSIWKEFISVEGAYIWGGFMGFLVLLSARYAREIDDTLDTCVIGNFNRNITVELRESRQRERIDTD